MSHERILAFCTATPWAIEPVRGEHLAAILSARFSGDKATADEVAAAKEIAADRDRRRAKSKPKTVALLPVYGVLTHRADFFTDVSGMTSYETLGRQIDDAAADPNAEAIVLDVDSPGGTVYGVEQAALKIRAAAGKKKVIAVVNALAASGAYWLASQASEVVVSPDGEVGSIGVYQMHRDVSRAADASGVKVTYVKAGKHKTAGNPYEPLGPEAAGQLQKCVDDFYDLFVRAVARGRNVSLTRVREGFGEGGTVRAREAVAEGMADKIGALDDVLGRYGATSADYLASLQPDMSGVEIRRRRMRMG
jgi:signal peptide peptidase SppA